VEKTALYELSWAIENFKCNSQLTDDPKHYMSRINSKQTLCIIFQLKTFNK
jgi:hypothetical protein